MSATVKMLGRVGIITIVLCFLFIFFTPPAQATNQAKPWEKWDYSKEKPVRGGYYRSASAVDVGLLNPNHWPVNDWWVISYHFEKLLTTKGDYREIP